MGWCVMIRRYYTVYEEKSETIIAYGTAEECAGQLTLSGHLLFTLSADSKPKE